MAPLRPENFGPLGLPNAQHNVRVRKEDKTKQHFHFVFLIFQIKLKLDRCQYYLIELFEVFTSSMYPTHNSYK